MGATKSKEDQSSGSNSLSEVQDDKRIGSLDLIYEDDYDDRLKQKRKSSRRSRRQGSTLGRLSKISRSSRAGSEGRSRSRDEGRSRSGSSAKKKVRVKSFSDTDTSKVMKKHKGRRVPLPPKKKPAHSHPRRNPAATHAYRLQLLSRPRTPPKPPREKSPKKFKAKPAPPRTPPLYPAKVITPTTSQTAVPLTPSITPLPALTSFGPSRPPTPTPQTRTATKGTSTFVTPASRQTSRIPVPIKKPVPNPPTTETINDYSDILCTPTNSTGPSSSSGKKKLIVRGLRHYRDTHKRRCKDTPTTGASTSRPGYEHCSTAGSSFPSIWSKEFPCKSKFHPDKYIYEWGEGPKAPPRPLSAMAKCLKHGGRCGNCGVFSRDICQCCKKCELDCDCPNKGSRSSPTSCPFPFPMEAYKEVFGGDGWTKVSKVLCDLTLKDKLNPVGGNAQSLRQATSSGIGIGAGDYCTSAPKSTPTLSSACPGTGSVRKRSPLNSKLYESQIDVLNPYKIPLSGESSESHHSHGQGQCHSMMPPYQYPMMMPPMYPMTVMPMPMMAPPVMPYYPPPPPPMSYDPYYGAGGGFPATDAFLPMQNY